MPDPAVGGEHAEAGDGGQVLVPGPAFSGCSSWSRSNRTASTASTPSSTSRAHSIRPYVVDSVLDSSDGRSASPIPVPAAYGPSSSRPRTAPAADAPHPVQTSRRARGSVRPAGQQSTRKASPPKSITPANDTHRATVKTTSTTGSVVPPTTAPVAATSGPSPTTNEKAPLIGCESADTIR